MARLTALRKQERASYESSLKEYRDLYSVMKTAKEEGRDEGIESVAITMIGAGMGDEKIVTLTKLSSGVVAALREKHCQCCLTFG